MGWFRPRCLLCLNPRESIWIDGRCRACQSLFLRCPRICPVCARMHALTENCAPAWQHSGVRVESIHALYLAVGKTFELIKKIKIENGRKLPRANHWIRADLRRALWREEVTVKNESPILCEIPQSPERRLDFAAPLVPTWRAELARAFDIPAVAALEPLNRGVRQGTLNATSRRMMKDRFVARELPQLRDRTLYLAEDIMTTGSTLNSALHALAALKPARVRVFLLGFRPLIATASSTRVDPAIPARSPAH